MQQSLRIVAGTAMLLVMLPIVSVGSFLAAFFVPEAAGMWFYNLAFSVLAKVCRAGADAATCSLTGGAANNWSWGLWIIVGLVFGWTTRNLRLPSRLAVACVVIALIVAAMRLAIPAFGGEIYVDAV